jgi:hypothetical protein
VAQVWGPSGPQHCRSFGGGGKGQCSESRAAAAAAAAAAALRIGGEHEGVGHGPNPRAPCLCEIRPCWPSNLQSNGPASPGQGQARGRDESWEELRGRQGPAVEAFVSRSDVASGWSCRGNLPASSSTVHWPPAGADSPIASSCCLHHAHLELCCISTGVQGICKGVNRALKIAFKDILVERSALHEPGRWICRQCLGGFWPRLLRAPRLSGS